MVQHLPATDSCRTQWTKVQTLDLLRRVTDSKLPLKELWAKLASDPAFAGLDSAQLAKKWEKLVGLSALVLCNFARQPCQGALGHLTTVWGRETRWNLPCQICAWGGGGDSSHLEGEIHGNKIL